MPKVRKHLPYIEDRYFFKNLESCLCTKTKKKKKEKDT